MMQLAGVLHVLFTMPILPHHHPVHCPATSPCTSPQINRRLPTCAVFGLAPAPGDFLGFADPAVAANDDAMHAVLDGLCAFRYALMPRSQSAARSECC